MNSAELKADLATLLAAELGTYVLTGGATTPAILLLNSGDVISDRTVTGLEVVIRRSPLSDESKPTFDGTRAAKMWQVFLIQWASTYTLEAAQNKIRRRFPNSRAIPIKGEKGSGIKEQTSVRIPDLIDFDETI